MSRTTKARLALTSLALAASLGSASCSAEMDSPDEEPAAEESAVKVDTSTPLARAQYDANVAFASGYRARCKPGTGKPRVLVTGFGRFQGLTNNATGRMLASLLPGLSYPETRSPPPGEIDPPGPQLAVAQGTLTLPRSGDVELCAMILPVYWDLAAILIAREIDAFGPDFVMMNGVAGSRQELWLELGSINKAAPLDDGSDQLRPLPARNAPFAPILESAGPQDQSRSNLLSWKAVALGAADSVRAHEGDMDRGDRFGVLAPGVKLAGFPRDSNTYLCNNITYITGYLMDYPGRAVQLLRASQKSPTKPNYVKAKIARDVRRVPRVFVHWPSSLADRHTRTGAQVMASIVDAQLAARATEPPARGDNASAAPDLRGGDTF